MATPSVLTFDTEGRAVDFEVWVDDLQLFLKCDRADSLSLFDLTSGASPAPPATAVSTVRSQWATRDEATRLAVSRHLPTTERAHFSQYKSAQTLDHFLSVCPTTLTVDLLKERLLTAEKSIVSVRASRGDPRTPAFEVCSPVPLLPSVASAAAADLVGFYGVGAASASSRRRRTGKGKGGKGARGAGGGSGGGGGGSGGGGGGGVSGGGAGSKVAAVEAEEAALVAEGAEAAEVVEAAEVAEAAEAAATVELVATLRRGVGPVVVRPSTSSAVVCPR
ncbi:unnamed protein product [Closterium sp. NIES-65]|nr:unnamed protein product [Closterium sp. NIES-65]